MTINHTLTTGDIVKLKKPYRPEEWVRLKDKAWRGFEFGIVVEIVSSQFSVNGEPYGDKQQPRNVSLHLYDATGQLMIYLQYLAKGLLIPTYVDFHLSLHLAPSTKARLLMDYSRHKRSKNKT